MAIRRERQPESTDKTNPVRWGLKCYKTEVYNNGCTHSCRSVAKEVEVVIFTEEIRFWLRRLELLATHDEVTAEVATCQKMAIFVDDFIGLDYRTTLRVQF